jgi:phosphohistidine phosphatase
MKTLWLVRHAKSSWQSDMLPDNERPLNERGYRDAHEMPARVLTGVAKPTCMWVSPAVRTYTTALIFARHLRFPSDQFSIAATLYESGVGEYLDILRRTADAHEQVMLFGHNPVITNLTNQLCKAAIDNVPTCGIVCIAHPQGNWSNLGKVPAQLLSFDFPKKSNEEITQRDA